jgi:hypothetical protein
MHATTPTNLSSSTSTAVQGAPLADSASPPGRPYGAKSRRVIEAISSGFNSLHRIAEFTQIDYRTVNSLVFSLEQQGRLIAHSTAVERRHRRFYVANPADNQPAKADPVLKQSDERDNQVCDFGPLGISFLLGGLPPQLSGWSTQPRVTQTRTRTHKSKTIRSSN